MQGALRIDATTYADHVLDIDGLTPDEAADALLADVTTAVWQTFRRHGATHLVLTRPRDAVQLARVLDAFRERVGTQPPG